MKAGDVTDTLELALEASGCAHAIVFQRPRLLSDNGLSYVAADLADYLEDKGMDHVRGAPHHPQTQGKIERWHQTMKSRVLLENYFLPGDLERQIDAFVDHYNNRRYHESLGNLASATARRFVVLGRPPRFAGGSRGAINAHSRSVISLGYPAPSRLCCLRAISSQGIRSSIFSTKTVNHNQMISLNNF